uniref:7TM_GPCR_Srx domain-containing protein n=1 Tax=Rhabditophanes sp. KR3021 TaxID=114890 RepID=A0AC35TPJ4_9BILA
MLTIYMLIGCILSLMPAIILIFLLPRCFLFCLRKKSWHFYYRNHLAIVLITVYGQVICCILLNLQIIIFNEIPFYSDNVNVKLFYDIVRYFQQTINSILRNVIERYVATKQRQSYEGKRSWGLIFGLFVFEYLCGMAVKGIGLFWLFWNNNMYRLSLGIDIALCLYGFYLLSLNTKLSKINSTINVDLSEKYQINENIRLIKLAMPLVFGFVGSNVIINACLELMPKQYFDVQTILAWNYVLLNNADLIFCVNFGMNNLMFNCTKIKTKKVVQVQSVVKNSNVVGDQQTYFQIFNNSWK